MTGVLGFATAIAFVGTILAAVAATRGLVARATNHRERRARDRDGAVLIGMAGRRSKPVSLDPDELQQGVLIGGSPGAGKTTLLTAVAKRLPAEIGCAFVDLKGDRALAARLAIPPERVFGLGDRVSAAFNPLDRGNPASWRDILMATQEWSEPHYRQAAARFVGACLAALDDLNDTVELDAVIGLLEQPKSATGLTDSKQGGIAMAASGAGTVREAMHEGAECIGENQTLLDAAKRMAELDVGVLPICGEDDRLKGMLTDRDIVVKALAQSRDPATTMCGEFAQGTVHWIAADASFDEALGMMREHAVKRLCVMDDNKRLSGMITEADVATHAPESKTGELVESIAAKPPQHF